MDVTKSWKGIWEWVKEQGNPFTSHTCTRTCSCHHCNSLYWTVLSYPVKVKVQYSGNDPGSYQLYMTLPPPHVSNFKKISRFLPDFALRHTSTDKPCNPFFCLSSQRRSIVYTPPQKNPRQRRQQCLKNLLENINWIANTPPVLNQTDSDDDSRHRKITPSHENIQLLHNARTTVSP